jgi:hypothetical protein
MRYKVTLKDGTIHEFNSPFQPDSLRKSMGLPLTAKIEVLEQPKEVSNEDQGNVG